MDIIYSKNQIVVQFKIPRELLDILIETGDAEPDFTDNNGRLFFLESKVVELAKEYSKEYKPKNLKTITEVADIYGFSYDKTRYRLEKLPVSLQDSRGSRFWDINTIEESGLFNAN